MAEHFEKLMSLIMTPQCYDDLFLKLNFTNVVCLKMIVSKGLGYAILAGALLLRVPQIQKILSAGSGKGISILSELLSLVAIFGTFSYGYLKRFPVSAYGDSFFIYVQSVIILLLILFYDKQFLGILVLLPLVVALTGGLFMGLIPANVILSLNGLSIGLGTASRLYQAFLNYQNASTGTLSAITLWLQFIGCVARIFTSLQETGDFTMILGFVIASISNGILVAQLVYYWNSAAAEKDIKAKKTN
jgi:mannose-P-dolichol utilization defect protein 1